MEAAQRAQYVLSRWKYRGWSIPGGIRFERAFSLSGLFAIHPHQVHTHIDLQIEEKPNGCSITAVQTVYKLGQPCSNLDKMVWKGDLDDLEAAVVHRAPLKRDRIKENGYAGAVSIKFIVVAVLPPLVAALWLLFQQNFVGSAAMIALLAIAAIVMPYLPFKMPHFPLEGELPPFDSNYPRSQYQG